MKDGSRTARPTIFAIPSSPACTGARRGPRIIGSSSEDQQDQPGEHQEHRFHAITPSSDCASIGPSICPAEPAAVAIPRLSDRRSGDAERPTTARSTPKPVPAMPKPISTFSSWCASGVTA